MRERNVRFLAVAIALIGFASLLYLPFSMGGGFSSAESFSEVGDSIEVSPEMEACYDAEAELTEEEWEQAVVPSECEGVFGDDSRFLAPQGSFEPFEPRSPTTATSVP